MKSVVKKQGRNLYRLELKEIGEYFVISFMSVICGTLTASTSKEYGTIEDAEEVFEQIRENYGMR